MKYELAKRLKDAGYPQDGYSGRYVSNTNRFAGWHSVDALLAFEDKVFGQHEEWAYVPDVRELLERLPKYTKPRGEQRRHLTLTWCGDWICGWTTFGGQEGSTFLEVASGSTPEDALAELWLTT